MDTQNSQMKTARGQGLGLALLAGTMAALGSVFAKLAFNGDIIHQTCRAVIPITICEQISLYLQGVSFGLVFLCNAVMWTLFTKSLQLCGSSVEATVTNTAANFMFSALVGWIFFAETLSLKWWIGSVIILFGLMLIHHGSNQDTPEKGSKVL